MKLLLLALVLAVVMVANSVAKPTKTKIKLSPELIEEIKSKGVEIFQKYLDWKDGLPPGSNTKFRTFLEWWKKQREATSLIAEDQAAEEKEETSSIVKAEADEENEEASPIAEDKENEEDEADEDNQSSDDEPTEILTEGDEKSNSARMLRGRKRRLL